MAKARLSMEAYRDLAEVADRYARGRISASKARGLCEAIIFDGVRIADVRPEELGGSFAETVAWALGQLGGAATVAEVAARRGPHVDRWYVAQMLSRLARRGRAERIEQGRYRLRR